MARSKFECVVEMSVRVFLVAHGCSFEDERFDVILNFLASAEIECPDDFVGLRRIIDIPGWEDGRNFGPKRLQCCKDR